MLQHDFLKRGADMRPPGAYERTKYPRANRVNNSFCFQGNLEDVDGCWVDARIIVMLNIVYDVGSCYRGIFWKF